MTPFDITKHILSKDKMLTDEEVESHFNLFMTNRIFSNDQQFIHLANEMNKKGYTKKMAFDCYFYGVPKTKRYIPYNSKKEKKDKQLEYMIQFYQCSLQTAKQYMELISDEDKQYIIDYFEKRGVKK